MKSLVRLIFLLTAACCVMPGPSVHSKKVSTRIKAPAPDKKETELVMRTYPHHLSEFEKVAEKLTFMAYDKKASADKETFFLDNGSDKSLSVVEIEISYFNAAKKQIHKRVVELSQDFPAKETRRVDIPSWDLQKSFHYINSVPSKKGSTPYTVRFKVLSFR